MHDFLVDNVLQV